MRSGIGLEKGDITLSSIQSFLLSSFIQSMFFGYIRVNSPGPLKHISVYRILPAQSYVFLLLLHIETLPFVTGKIPVIVVACCLLPGEIKRQ